MEVQFNEINWSSGVSLNISTRSSNSLASLTGQIEVDTSIEIDFPSNENELTFEFQLNDGSQEIEINDGEIYNITVRQIQCSNTDNNEQFESNDISIVEYEDDDYQNLCEYEYNQEQFMLQSPNYPRKYPNGNSCHF